MAFSVKQWFDRFGSGGSYDQPTDTGDVPDTPLDAAGQRDQETRLSAYTDSTLAAHTGAATAAHAASAVSFAPTGSVGSTTAQAAIAEVASEAASALTSGLAGKADLSGGHVPLAQLGSGTPASGKYVDGASGAWLSLPAQSGNGTAPSTETFTMAGTLAQATGHGPYVFPTAGVLVSVSAAVDTAPTGAAIKVDVNKNGTTVFTTQANRPTIAAGTKVSSAAVPDVTAFAAGDVMTVDIDQIGSSVAGADLAVVPMIVLAAVSGGTPTGVAAHAHVIGDTTGLQAALDAKLAAASNLSDLASAATARTNLGLGTAATQATGAFDAAGAATTAAAASVPKSLVTTAGDLIVATGNATVGRVAKGSNNTVFGVDGSGTLGYKADPAGGGTAYDRKSEQLWRPAASLGSNIPILGSSLNHTNTGLATGRMIFAGGYTLPAGSAIAHLRMVSNVTSVGMTHSWLAILDQSWQLLAVTNDLTTDWTADTVRTWDVTLASSGADRALMFGIVFVYATTPPSPASVLSISNIMSRTPIICATSFPTTYTTPGALTIGSTFTTPTNFLGQHFFVEVT